MSQIGASSALGDPVRGRFRFDAAIAGSDTAPNVDTGHYGPLALLQYSIGSYSGGLGSGTSRFEIWDNRTSNDAYRIFAADPAGAEIAGHAPFSFIMDLRDSTQLLFSSDAFPPTALARTDFTSGRIAFRFQQGGGAIRFIVTDVTILMTPLPSPSAGASLATEGSARTSRAPTRSLSTRAAPNPRCMRASRSSAWGRASTSRW